MQLNSVNSMNFSNSGSDENKNIFLLRKYAAQLLFLFVVSKG